MTCCVCAVRLVAGGVGRAQRELHARDRARAGRQRPAAALLPRRLHHLRARGDRTLPPLPHPGFLLFYYFNLP